MPEQNGKKGRFNQVFITLIICLAIFFAAVFSATIFFIFKVLPTRSEDPAAKSGATNKKDNIVKYLVPLDEPLVINLADPGGRRYIRVNLTIAVDSEETQLEIIQRRPQIRDLIIKVFRTKTEKEIEGKEGSDKVRNEIINVINENISSGKVVDLFFTDFVVT